MHSKDKAKIFVKIVFFNHIYLIFYISFTEKLMYFTTEQLTWNEKIKKKFMQWD